MACRSSRRCGVDAPTVFCITCMPRCGRWSFRCGWPPSAMASNTAWLRRSTGGLRSSRSRNRPRSTSSSGLEAPRRRPHLGGASGHRRQIRAGGEAGIPTRSWWRSAVWLPVKRLDRFVEAMALLESCSPELRGGGGRRGYERPELEERIARHGATAWLTLPGRVQRRGARLPVSACVAGRSTSVREGWGMTLTEAVAVTPAVATTDHRARRGGRRRRVGSPG